MPGNGPSHDRTLEKVAAAAFSAVVAVAVYQLLAVGV